MYGHKRIVLKTNGHVIRAGGKSFFHIGYWTDEGIPNGPVYVARVNSRDNRFLGCLTDPLIFKSWDKNGLRRQIAAEHLPD